jgi:hypothetical protein
MAITAQAVPECGPHRKGDGSFWAYDARGIPLKRVCERCEHRLRDEFRPDVLTDSNYWHDEPIEGD